MKRVTFLLMAALWTSASGAELTLGQALQLAETHAWSLRQSQAALLGASESVKAARAERFPTLSASGVASYVDDIARLQIAIPNLFTIEREIGSHERYQADFRLTLPLFTGGKIGSAVETAKANEAYARALERADQNAVRYATRAEYFGLYRSLRLLAAAGASLRRTTIIRSDIAAQHEAGAVDSVDVVDAELAYTKADFAQQQAAIGVRAAQIQILVRLGLQPGDSVQLTETLPTPPETLPAAQEQLARPEVAAALAGIDLNRAAIRREQAEYFPSLAVYSGYSYGKPNLNSFANDWNDYVTVGANLTWSFNIGNKTRARRAAARLGMEAAQYNHDQIAERVDKEARLAYEQLRQAHEQFLRARAEQRLAEISFRLAGDRHREGVLSTNRLLELETTLTQAEAALATAVADYYIAQSAYWYATGSEDLGKGL